MEFVGVDKFSLLDYEGHMAVVLFTPLCNFACPYCHNKGLLCPQEIVFPFDQVLSFLTKRKGIIDGVVITGGEPTLHDDVVDKIREIKKLGFDVKLDTNGTNPDMIKKLVDEHLIDYVAMDIKNCFDSYEKTVERHVDMDKVKESIKYLMEDHVDYEFRTTMVEKLHHEEDIIKMSKDIAGAKKLYLQKFVNRDGINDPTLHEVPQNIAEEYKKILQRSINLVELRGY